MSPYHRKQERVRQRRAAQKAREMAETRCREYLEQHPAERTRIEKGDVMLIALYPDLGLVTTAMYPAPPTQRIPPPDPIER